MALFITSKVHFTSYNFIIPTIHNIYDASIVTIVRCLAGFITQPKIHLTIRADKAVQWTSSHLLHTLFCKNLVFVFCCVQCGVYCCNEKKRGGIDRANILILCETLHHPQWSIYMKHSAFMTAAIQAGAEMDCAPGMSGWVVFQSVRRIKCYHWQVNAY